MKTKFIFVTGGVVSSLGKGISASSIGRILKNRGLKVFMQKFDPYLNVDPGTMSPFQHGEVFVTDDGAETDLDLGHYERFIDENLTREASVTAGKVYSTVINNERRGVYLGRTVQVIPHITNEIKDRVMAAALKSNADIVITEIGGTVGDIESLPFLEAIRQCRREFGYNNTLYVHNTLVPYLKAAGEIKTKPTQHSVKELRSLGISPDIIILRTEEAISEEVREKIALFCDVSADAVFEARDQEVLYDVPIKLHEQGIDRVIIKHFQLECPEAEMSEWNNMVHTIKHLKQEVKIGLIGKYIQLKDAYLSVCEALRHAGYFHHTKIHIIAMDSSDLKGETIEGLLDDLDGILIPGGFGNRGVRGKLAAIQYARTHKVPCFGICFGMQLICIEYAQNVLGFVDANSAEIDQNTSMPIIDYLPEQYFGIDMGGTMRLGLYDCHLLDDTIAKRAYQQEKIGERHRHRYEFNNRYVQQVFQGDLIVSGINQPSKLVEIVELKNHPWLLGCQFHPEFLSRPHRAHPLFIDFIGAVLTYSQKK